MYKSLPIPDLDGTVESTYTIAKLKTKIEESSTFTAKNKALSLNPAAKIEEKQFETDIENMIKSIKTLALPVPTRSKPLSDLLQDNAVFHFGPKQQLAFQTLRQKLSENPVLHIFKQGAKLELHTDASKFGYGAILLQQSDDSKFHPVHYFNKKTIPQEEKYSSYELELLAIIESLKKFRNYLVGNKFKIVTDCSAFQKTMSKTQLTPKIAIWALFLEDLDYEIMNRPGKQMGHVDCLSICLVMTITYD
ncbi:transposon Tf2-8 polyprotein [Trichonephila clavipes]|nr:transposon Tf2-8 polyprotein [Trichonephila clavipes]